MEHETGEGQKMQPRQGRCQPLVIAGETAETCCSGEIALDNPSARLHLEAVGHGGKLEGR
jgi:hypothetical protein